MALGLWRGDGFAKLMAGELPAAGGLIYHGASLLRTLVGAAGTAAQCQEPTLRRRYVALDNSAHAALDSS